MEVCMKWWNNGAKTVRSSESPGENYVPGRLTFKRSSPTQETRDKVSKSLIGNIPWNKGVKTGPEPAHVREKKKFSALARGASPWNVGRKSWSKGLTAEDPRVGAIFEKQKGQKRTGNFVTGPSHPNWNPERREYRRYLEKVRNLSEANYAEHIDIINPNRHPRTLAGVPGGYQLDHKISAKLGFKNGTKPEEIASVENLQMLPWRENIMKGWK